MAITATLVEQGQNRLRYLVVATGTTALALTITSTGAATPDLLTDSASTNGIVRKAARANLDGYGAIAPITGLGVMTQAQARAIWLSDDPTGLVAPLGQNTVPHLVCKTTSLTAGVDAPQVDANISAGHAAIVVTAAAAGSSFLDIEAVGVTGAIGA